MFVKAAPLPQRDRAVLVGDRGCTIREMQRPPGSDSASRRAATFETDDSGRVGNCFNCVICSNERAHEGENYDEPCILFFSSRVVELVDRRACRSADNLAIQITRSRGGHCTEGDGPRPRRRRLSGAGWVD